MGAFDTWRFLAGLGIFLFAMYLMEESIRKLSGRAFKALIRRYTGSRWRALMTGTLSTAILQSSSAVSLMLLAFVGAGLMSMPHAIGVILGSNLGTTVTAWIVASVGFKVEIESIAMPLLGVGGLGMIFSGQSEKYANFSKLLLGFGFLFLGLDHMKGSIEMMAEQVNIVDYVDMGLWFFLLLGILLTALMQSSSATLAVVLTALYSNIITFDMGAVMVVGSNIGTTITILLGALGGGKIKLRVALSHFIFNNVTGIIALIALPLLTGAVNAMLPVDQEPVLALALFHTFFNVMGILLFFPFIGLLARLLIHWVPDPKNTVSRYLIHTTSEVVEPAITAVEKEMDHFLELTMRHNLQILNIDETLIWPDTTEEGRKVRRTQSQQYERLKLLQAQIFKFTAEVQTHETTEQETARLSQYLHGARLLLHSAKIFKDIRHNFEDFQQSDSRFLRQAYSEFRRRFVDLSMQLARVLIQEDSSISIETYERLMAAVKQNDNSFIRSVSGVLKGAPSLTDVDISTAIIVNRSFIYACQHLIDAWHELSDHHLLSGEGKEAERGKNDTEGGE